MLVELDRQFAQLSPAGEIERILPISLDGISGPSTLHWLNDTQIAYSLSFNGDSGNRISKLLTYDLNQNREQLLTSMERIYDACWNQTEQVFVLVTQKPTAAEFRVYGNTLSIYDPLNDQLSQLLSLGDGVRIIGVACSRNDGLVAFVELEGHSGNDTHRLVTLDIRTKVQSIPYATSNLDFDSPTWSPDSRWIAVRSLQGKADSPRPGIMLIAADGSETRTVMEPNISTSPIDIAWSPIEENLLIRSKEGFRKYSLYLLDLTSWLTEEPGQ